MLPAQRESSRAEGEEVGALLEARNKKALTPVWEPPPPADPPPEPPARRADHTVLVLAALGLIAVLVARECLSAH